MNGNQQQPVMPPNPLVNLANVLNQFAPHNVLRNMLAGTPLAMGGQQPVQNGGEPGTPPVYPEGIRERWAKRKGMTVAQYDAERSEAKRKSETAGYSVQGRTIIF